MGEWGSCMMGSWWDQKWKFFEMIWSNRDHHLTSIFTQSTKQETKLFNLQKLSFSQENGAFADATWEIKICWTYKWILNEENHWNKFKSADLFLTILTVCDLNESIHTSFILLDFIQLIFTSILNLVLILTVALWFCQNTWPSDLNQIYRGDYRQ